jgi:hypothetical protein
LPGGSSYRSSRRIEATGARSSWGNPGDELALHFVQLPLAREAPMHQHHAARGNPDRCGKQGQGPALVKETCTRKPSPKSMAAEASGLEASSAPLMMIFVR